MTAIPRPNGTAADTVSFKCTLCGKCCDTAPLMSVPELFHHETLFVGGLAIRRVKRHREGETLAAGAMRYRVSRTDAGEISRIADSVFFRLEGVRDPGYDFSILGQALDYESTRRCPALGEDNRCSIQDDRKPAVCSMVPFDALFPDGMQPAVLMSRDLGTDCIVRGRADGHEVLVNEGRLLSPEYRRSIDRRRLDLADEKRYWGHSVFALLNGPLLDDPGARERIPFDGFLSLPMVPVLLVLSGVSENCRTRCLRYADSQIALLDEKIRQAIRRKNGEDKPVTQLFRSFKEAYLKLRKELPAHRRETRREAPETEPEKRRAAIEQYLGVSS